MSSYAFRFNVFENVTQVGQKIAATFGQMRQSALRFGDAVDESGDAVGRLSRQGVGLTNSLAGIGATLGLTAFGRSVVDTLAEFEKFEAVLTNTLGSNSAARTVLQDITQFAASTPFQVDELADSFVRLQNRGMLPNLEMMRQIGDLAASQGKPFQQVAEALMDAPVGQFIRLQEALGIDAKQLKNNMLQLQGLGQTRIIANTPEEIKRTVLEFSKLPQVAGSMSAISKTTGGQLSNLQDSFTAFKLSIGQAFQPLFAEWIPRLQGALTEASGWVSEHAQALRSMGAALLEIVPRAAAVYGIYRGIGALHGLWKWGIEGAFGFATRLTQVWTWLSATGIQMWSLVRTTAIWAFQSVMATGRFIAGLFASRTSLAVLQFQIGTLISLSQTWLARALAGVVTWAISMWTTAIPAMGAWIMSLNFAAVGQTILNTLMLANPVGLFIAGVLTLGAVFVGVFKLINGLFPGFFEGITMWFKKAWDFIYDIFIAPIVKFFKFLGDLTGVSAAFSTPTATAASEQSALPGLETGQASLLASPLGALTTPKAQGDLGLSRQTNSVSGGGREGVKHISINIGKQIENFIVQNAREVSDIGAAVRREVEAQLLVAVNNANYAN